MCRAINGQKGLETIHLFLRNTMPRTIGLNMYCMCWLLIELYTAAFRVATYRKP